MRAAHATPIAAGELREPRLPAGRDFDGHRFVGLHYRRYRGDLFAGRISGYVIGQGDLGDCYFLSSLAAVANADPARIRRAVVAHGDGTFTVTFWERTPGVVRPVPIRVDTRFPADARGRQSFARGLTSGPHGQTLWPAVFEKAFAAWQHGYVHVNQGGDGGFALTALTGMPSRTLTPANRPPGALWERLVERLRGRHPMVTSTPSARELRRRSGRADLGGLLDDHYYAVVGVSERRGRRLLRLYTPLVDFTAAPVSTPSPRDDRRRHTELAFDDWRREFDQLVTGRLSRG